MQKVVFTLKNLLDSNLEEIIDNANPAIECVKNILNNKEVEFIPLDDLKHPELLGEGGFGYITKAIWTKINNYVVYNRLINTTTLKYNALNAFIHELNVHLHLNNYSDRIIRCLGISQGNLSVF